MKAHEFETSFDNNEDITQFLEVDRAARPGLKTRRVNIDFPEWMIERLDREAKRAGVTRQSIIKIWISEYLDSHEPRR